MSEEIAINSSYKKRAEQKMRRQERTIRHFEGHLYQKTEAIETLSRIVEEMNAVIESKDAEIRFRDKALEAYIEVCEALKAENKEIRSAFLLLTERILQPNQTNN